MNRSRYLDLLLYMEYIVFLVSMICCFRAVSSISIGLVLVTGLLKNKTDTGSWLNMRLHNRFLAACCLFYLVQLILLFYTGNFSESAKNLQLKSALLFVPLALCCSNYLNAQVREKLMGYFIWALVTALLYCLLIASYKYSFRNAPNNVFFYHGLVSPFRQHAVMVSVYVFVGLVYLLEKSRQGYSFYHKTVHFLLIFYFTCCILLLSSKLVIGFSAGCLVYYFFMVFKTKPNNRLRLFVSLFAGLVMILLVLLTKNRISSRFNEIMAGDLSLVEQKSFGPAVYFNGLQFRLLQGRFVKEILTEQHAWLTGVADSAQALLNKKYISTQMFTGDANTGNRGYLGYNTHDQFLQSVLESGIPGLIVFILVCVSLICLAIRERNRELTLVVILLIAYCFNESVFETQYGIMMFTFFPLFLYYGPQQKNPGGRV